MSDDERSCRLNYFPITSSIYFPFIFIPFAFTEKRKICNSFILLFKKKKIEIKLDKEKLKSISLPSKYFIFIIHDFFPSHTKYQTLRYTQLMHLSSWNIWNGNLVADGTVRSSFAPLWRYKSHTPMHYSYRKGWGSEIHCTYEHQYAWLEMPLFPVKEYLLWTVSRSCEKLLGYR